ncbi:MAG: AAA family ATPase [Candidatus Micrarchaeia archaeon]
MMLTFEELMERSGVFKDMNMLSPHYIPDVLPHREEEIETIMKTVAPALKNTKPKNMFLYGKTGTGKTCSTRLVMEKFNAMNKNAIMRYMNCRIYDSRYKIIFKIVNDVCKEDAKMGYPLSKLYESMLEWVEQNNTHTIIVLDEIDMVDDVDDLVYTMTRINDELERGSVSIIGISNRLHFKEKLDPRSKSALYEKEIVFRPYNATQLYEILKQRAEGAFIKEGVEDAAIRLAAAVAARETGDARYAVKLLHKAGVIANENGDLKVTEKHVENARKSVDEDLVVEAITTLPQHEQIALYGISLLQLKGSAYKRLGEDGQDIFMSGEVYESYVKACKSLSVTPRSARWFSEYLNDLDMLGLIALTSSGKGTRGQTRFIKLAYDPARIKAIVEKIFS